MLRRTTLFIIPAAKDKTSRQEFRAALLDEETAMQVLWLLPLLEAVTILQLRNLCGATYPEDTSDWMFNPVLLRTVFSPAGSVSVQRELVS